MSEPGDVVSLLHQEQIERWTDAFDRCRQKIQNQTKSGPCNRSSSLSSSSSSSSGVYCAATWDDIMCWPESPAGQTIQQPCPNYINRFRTNEANKSKKREVRLRRVRKLKQSSFMLSSESRQRTDIPDIEFQSFEPTSGNASCTGHNIVLVRGRARESASRECLPNGQWFVHPVLNRTWTNFSACLGTEPNAELSLMQIHLPHIRILYHIGYGVSLVSLIAALIITVYFRKLRCPRNFLHANLFLSFVLRAVVALVRDNILELGVGLRQDFYHDEEDGTLSFISDGLHWECRLLHAVFSFSVAANYTWIFVEGLYLHTLVFVNFYTERSSIWCYVAFGWLFPAAIVSTWVVVRATLQNELCWNTHQTTGFLWIIKAPIALSILINFAFFLNILRILYTKLTLNRISAGGKDRIKRRLAKSILVLIPLFGVPYVLFLVLLEKNLTESVTVIKLYFEMAFNSFNGLVVAILFCFANFEVQAELRKHWHRMRTRSYCSGGCLGLSRQRSEARVSTNPFFNDCGTPCRRMVVATVHPCRPRRRLFLRDRSGQRRRHSDTDQCRGYRVSLNSACSTSRILPDEDDVDRLSSKPEVSPSIVEMEEVDKKCAEAPENRL